MQKTVLVTGGAGYIGSHIAWLLTHYDYNVIIIDNLHYNQPYYAPWATFIQGDFADRALLDTLCNTHNIEAIIHCAAFIDVATSLKEPRYYYDNNLFKTGKLLDAMLAHGIKKIIFSSTCAVYGVPTCIPIAEEQACNPITPYGTSKYMVERMLADFNRAYNLQFVILRYFNAAGAEPEHNLGERHNPETHLIPRLLQAMHEKKPFMLFGTNYNTPDGSCIRDFLHVTDIAYAHYLALRHLEQGQPSDHFNLGTGKGTSIKQLIKLVERTFEQPIKVITAPHREGDPAYLVADPTKIEQILHWQPKYSNLTHILQSAYTFMLKHQEQAQFWHRVSHPL